MQLACIAWLKYISKTSKLRYLSLFSANTYGKLVKVMKAKLL